MEQGSGCLLTSSDPPSILLPSRYHVMIAGGREPALLHTTSAALLRSVQFSIGMQQQATAMKGRSMDWSLYSVVREWKFCQRLTKLTDHF